MKQKESGAFILSETKNGERIVSCGGRISTRPGSAIELYKKATDKQKNLNLISKVVASGHKTILEHHYFNLAFNNVSIFVEQFLIEFRLCSFTIKSGRYVNFSNAGFNLPDEFSEEQKTLLKKHYKHMFEVYDKFVSAGVPVEDARFVLPYGLKTNIYMSANARELVHIVCTMIYGRGKNYPEIKKLGLMLKCELDKRYPNLVEQNEKYYTQEGENLIDTTLQKVDENKITFVSHKVKLNSYQKNASDTIQQIAKSSGYKNFDFNLALFDDKFAKMLEHFNYTFTVQNFAMIILKHFTRHRMQSLSTEPIVKMAMKDKFVCPESIGKERGLKETYIEALKENRKVFNILLDQKVDPYLLIYVTPHAVAIDFISTMNARELLHLCNLRNCNRAQWEIRNLSVSMLRELKKVDKKMFENYGPNCYTYGVCPEGRLCCGKQVEMKEKFQNLQ